MDHSKVNGLSVSSQVHATAAQPPRATQAATDRFSRAMGESPATASDASSASGMVRGTPIQNLTREAAQDNREHAYRRWQAPAGGSAMSGVLRDLAADADPAAVPISASVWPQLAVTAHVRSMAAARSASGGELTQMLERMCSALYVGEKSVGTQRIVMALDHVLPGAAAEIVREGVHLSIRLHARTEESYRSMSSQREALARALSGDGERHVDVSIIQGIAQGSGDGHG